MTNIIKFVVYVLLALVALTLVIKVVGFFANLILGMLLPILVLGCVLYVVYLVFGRGSRSPGAPHRF